MGLLGAGTLWATFGVGVGAVIRQPEQAVVTALLCILALGILAWTTLRQRDVV